MWIRLILLIIVGFILYRFLRPFLSPPKPNEHVKGKQSKEKAEDQRRQGRIEDADYEEIE